MKGTLSLTNSSLEFKPSHSDQLFFGQYEYSISCYLRESGILREMTHEAIDKNISIRRDWLSTMSGRWGRAGVPVTVEIEQNLHKLCDFFSNVNDYKLYVGTDSLRVYTNDISLLEKLNQIEFLKNKKYKQAVITRPKNTITLKNPKHQYRVYMRSMKLTHESKARLKNFVFCQTTDVRINPSFDKWLNDDKYIRLWETFFVDYNAENWPTMLALVCPGSIRKTLKLIPTK
jgi:hypothetical protein